MIAQERKEMIAQVMRIHFGLKIMVFITKLNKNKKNKMGILLSLTSSPVTS